MSGIIICCRRRGKFYAYALYIFVQTFDFFSFPSIDGWPFKRHFCFRSRFYDGNFFLKKRFKFFCWIKDTHVHYTHPGTLLPPFFFPLVGFKLNAEMQMSRKKYFWLDSESHKFQKGQPQNSTTNDGPVWCWLVRLTSRVILTNNQHINIFKYPFYRSQSKRLLKLTKKKLNFFHNSWGYQDVCSLRRHAGWWRGGRTADPSESTPPPSSYSTRCYYYYYYNCRRKQ